MDKEVNPFDDHEPDHISPHNGQKFWLIDGLNNKFKEAGVKMTASNVLFPTGEKERIIIDNKKGKVIYETKSFEAICYRVNVLIKLNT